jgi:hypothetical protein
MSQAVVTPHKPPMNRPPPPDSVKIRSHSDVIYLYPSWLMSLGCALWVTLSEPSIAAPGTAGIFFTLLFFFNLSVIAFDYTRLTSIIFVLVMVIIGLLAAIYPAVGEVLHSVLDQPLYMNSTFYWVWFTGLTLILGLVLLRSRFDYWEIKNQELLHHHGLLGDVERWPAPNMRISKEINDVMEYVLLGAGRLVLMPARESRAIVIKNVVRINRIEKKMQAVLSTLRVVDGD